MREMKKICILACVCIFCICSQYKSVFAQVYAEEQVFVVPRNLFVTTESKLIVAMEEKDDYLTEEIAENYPDFKIVMYETADACFQAIRSKEADIVLGDRSVLTPYLIKPAFWGLKAVPMKELEKNTYTYTIGDFAYQYKIFLLALFAANLLICVLVYRSIHSKQKMMEMVTMKNEQLAEAMVQINKANDSKSQFLAQMSHEIRTPLNAIVGLTTIASYDIKKPDKMKEYLSKIENSSRMLLEIINDVLDMSAIESKKLTIVSTEFNFKQLLTSITTTYYKQCKQKDIRFEMRMKGLTEETLIGDAVRVNQVLMNLLSNAVKFTQAGGEVNVLVIQGSTSKDMVHIRFVVSDTGCGMSEDLKKRLFKPFEQENAATARKHGGSGLGLAITKNLVEMMNGSIQVESKKGVGSVFTVDLPFTKANREENVNMATNFSDLRALIVDDDEEACQYTGILMERLNVSYKYVTSGKAALEELGESEDRGEMYNICFIDWKMPDMDGISVTQEIRNIFGTDTIIIIVSAYDLNEVEVQGKKAGADYFIPKPLFQSTVFDILMNISGSKYTKVDVEKKITDKYDFTGKKVLLAEDVALNMEVAVNLLALVHIQTICAEDGVEAMRIYEKSEIDEFDAILLDINMPNKDGYETAREIRSSNRKDAKTIPIYAMTANAFSEDVTAALNAGMNGHIAKPIETEVLYKTLEEAFVEHGNE